MKSWEKTATLRPVDLAKSGDDAIAPGAAALHSQLVCPVAHEWVELDEGALVAQGEGALARAALAPARLLLRGGGVLGRNFGFELVPAAGL